MLRFICHDMQSSRFSHFQRCLRLVHMSTKVQVCRLETCCCTSCRSNVKGRTTHQMTCLATETLFSMNSRLLKTKMRGRPGCLEWAWCYENVKCSCVAVKLFLSGWWNNIQYRMGLCLTSISLHIFIPPQFYLCICCWGDGIKAHLRTAAKVWRQLWLRHNFSFIYMSELENVNSSPSAQTHRNKNPRDTFLTQQGLVSPLLAVCKPDWRSDLHFDWTARKYLDFRKSQIVLLELWPDPLQRRLHELEAKREGELPKSLAVRFPWETKLWRPHRLALSGCIVLSSTHPHAGLLHTHKSSFCGSHWQNSPLLSELSSAASDLWMCWL